MTFSKLISKQWIVYILKCKDNSFYTGITTDINKRYRAHQIGTGAKYTRGRSPLIIIYNEKQQSKKHAMKREAYIKSLTKKEKISILFSRQL